jgi:hypothetical protein
VAAGSAGAEDDRSGRIPQMSTARARDGGRTQSGGVKGVIALEPGPEPNGNLCQNWNWLSLCKVGSAAALAQTIPFVV